MVWLSGITMPNLKDVKTEGAMSSNLLRSWLIPVIVYHIPLDLKDLYTLVNFYLLVRVFNMFNEK